MTTRPSYKFRVHDRTLIIPAEAGRRSRATHERISNIGSRISGLPTKTDMNARNGYHLVQRKVIRPKSRRETLQKVFTKSRKTIELLHQFFHASSLEKNIIFQKLDDIALNSVINQMFLMEFKAGDEVQVQGEPTNKFCIIEDGLVEISTRPKLKVQTKENLSIIFENSSFTSWRETVTSFQSKRTTFNEILNREQAKPMKPKSYPKRNYVKNYKAKNSIIEPIKVNGVDKIVVGEETIIGTASAGQFFGELSLVQEGISSSTMRALNNVTIWAIERKQFHKILTESSKRQRKQKLAFLTSTELFAGILDDKQLNTLTEAVEINTYDEDHVIQTIGDGIKKFIWVQQGEVGVFNEFLEKKSKTPINILKHGASFGEVALLEGCLPSTDEPGAKIRAENKEFTLSEYHLVCLGKTIIFELDILEAEQIIGSLLDIFSSRNINKNYTLPSEMSYFNESNLTELQATVEKMKLNMTKRMTNRMTGFASFKSTSRESDFSERNEKLLNPIDLDYVECKPLISSEDIGVENLYIISHLGSGCFGDVHLVRNTAARELSISTSNGTKKETINLFAIKIVRRFHEEDSMWQSGLDNELQAWSEVCFMTDSPFVTKLYHSFADDKFVYFLEEFCSEGTMFDIMQNLTRRRLGKLEHKQFYISNVVLGLEAIHSRSIVFRDLKPENILMSKDGSLKIADFGLCKKSFRTFTVCGTPDYMSPEVILARGHDSATDLWSLGVLLFEMSIGDLPFPSRDDMEIYEAAVAHKKGEFDRFERKNKVEIYTNYARYEARLDEFMHAATNMSVLSGSSTEEDEMDLIEDVVYVEESTWDIINSLMEPKKTKRLGTLASGYDGLKAHKFFDGLDWSSVMNSTAKPPFIPHDREQEIIQELEDGDPYEIQTDKVPIDRTQYKPIVNTVIDGMAQFAKIETLDI